MPQALVSPSDIKGDHVHIHGPEAHHLIRVLRTKVDDRLSLFDGTGAAYEARCLSVDSAAPSLEAVITSRSPASTRTHQIHLLQGLPRGAKFDYVLEKAVELGADAVVPFLSQKNLISLTPSQALTKSRRWKSLGEAASKQCGRSTVPVIEEARSLEDLAPRLKAGLSFFFDADATETLKTLLATPPSGPKLINIVVGPESGFAPDEAEWLVQNGARRVSLGPRTLRSETAGLVALAVINHELGL
jgi:16S rRNA (uracil1498-N3)-methyltransferase